MQLNTKLGSKLHHVVIVGGGAGGLELATRLGNTLGRKGKAKQLVVATGTAQAKKAGRVTVRLTAVRAYRKQLGRVRGKRITLRIVFGGRTTTKSVTLR